MTGWIEHNLGAMVTIVAAVGAIVIQHQLMLWRVSKLEESRKEFRESVSAQLEEMRHEIDRECDSLIRRIETGESQVRSDRSDSLQRLSALETKAAGLDGRIERLERAQDRPTG